MMLEAEVWEAKPGDLPGLAGPDGPGLAPPAQVQGHEVVVSFAF
jgi:hypothetical protein